MKNSVVAIGAIVALVVGMVIGKVVKDAGIPVVQVSISMQGELSGVQVMADGSLVGATDSYGHLSFGIKRKIGETVRVSFGGEDFESIDTTFTVTELRSHSFDQVAMLTKEIPFALQVQTKDERGLPVSQAKVLVDGVVVGLTDSGNWSGTVTRPLHTQIVVSVEGAVEEKTLDIKRLTDRASLSFEMKSGLPVSITTANKVGGVEVLVNGQSLGRTNAEGRGQFGVPIKEEGATLSFRLDGTRIDNWTISGAQMRAEKPLEYMIKVKPLDQVKIKLRAFMAGNPGQKAKGFQVSLNGQRKNGWVTRNDGRLEISLRPLIGDRIKLEAAGTSSSGRKGFGRRTVVIKPAALEYDVNIPITVPDIIKITVVDEDDSPVPRVVVKKNGEKIGETNVRGEIEYRVTRLNVEYDFTFHKNGYSLIGGKSQLRVNPKTDFTERAVKMQSLYFKANFIDSKSKQPAFDIEVYSQGQKMVTTDGMQAKIPISSLGTHSFELRSKARDYPPSQTVQVEIKPNGGQHTIHVRPRDIEFALEFLLGEQQRRPIKNKQVKIQGTGYIDQKRTDDQGKVVFSHPRITIGEEYPIELVLPQGSKSWRVKASGYVNKKTFVVSLCGKFRITTLPGQESARLSLYRSQEDQAMGRAPLHTGTGVLEVECLAYGEYLLLAVGEAEIRRVITVSGPGTEVVDTSDPYEKGVQALEKGTPADTVKGMELFKKVSRGSVKNYHDANKKLGFYYLGKKQYADATQYFDNAMDVQHRADPFFYLGACQAHHRAGTYDKGIEYCRKAITYRNMFGRERQSKGCHAEYLQALCKHDKFFQMEQQERSALTHEQTCSLLDNLLVEWDNYQGSCPGYERDAQTKVSQIQAILISSGCGGN